MFWNKISQKLKITDFSANISLIKNQLNKALFHQQHIEQTVQWTPEDFNFDKIRLLVNLTKERKKKERKNIFCNYTFNSNFIKFYCGDRAVVTFKSYLVMNVTKCEGKFIL